MAPLADRVALLLACALALVSCGGSRPPQPPEHEPRPALETKVSLEEQLERLKAAGIVLNEGVTEADITSLHSRAELEQEPFRLLVETLANDIEREPFTPMADRIWMCDFERIEDHGDYRAVLLRLERMTGGALGLADITDHVDLEAGQAWVAFTFKKRPVHWNLKVDDDWLDPEVLIGYDELLAAGATQVRVYANLSDSYGQAPLFGAFTLELKRVFDDLTGIPMPLLAQ